DEAPSRRRIFVCHPAAEPPPPTRAKQLAKDDGAGDESCARAILSTLARRAYRRPVTTEDVEPLLGLFRERRGDGFDAGIQLALQRLLVSPQCPFRIERDPASVAPGSVYRISDLELASRLSFFLWSSIPDDALLEVAAKGKLKDAAVLEQQVRRMLAD